jgi:hypothetical protein
MRPIISKYICLHLHLFLQYSRSTAIFKYFVSYNIPNAVLICYFFLVFCFPSPITRLWLHQLAYIHTSAIVPAFVVVSATADVLSSADVLASASSPSSAVVPSPDIASTGFLLLLLYLCCCCTCPCCTIHK